MSTDAPQGDLEMEPQQWDLDRLRAVEAKFGERYAVYCTGAVHSASGQLVGFTQLMHRRHSPRWAYQWDTLVRSEHRGHRLGVLMKIANLRRLVQESPRTEFVATFNDESNVPMVAVNDMLGFVPAGELRTYGKRLAAR